MCSFKITSRISFYYLINYKFIFTFNKRANKNSRGSVAYRLPEIYLDLTPSVFFFVISLPRLIAIAGRFFWFFFVLDSSKLMHRIIRSSVSWCDGFTDPLLVPHTSWLQPPLPLHIKCNYIVRTRRVKPTYARVP